MEKACCSSLLEDYYICATRWLHMHILLIMHVSRLLPSITILFGALRNNIYWESLLFGSYLDQLSIPVDLDLLHALHSEKSIGTFCFLRCLISPQKYGFYFLAKKRRESCCAIYKNTEQLKYILCVRKSDKLAVSEKRNILHRETQQLIDLIRQRCLLSRCTHSINQFHVKIQFMIKLLLMNHDMVFSTGR